MYNAKEKKDCPLLKIFNPRESRGGLDCRHEISNHGLDVLFSKSKPCPLVYSHLYQPEEVKGAQAECQF